MARSVEELVTIVSNVDFREFWWGSTLLEECRHLKDPRLIKALILRHHGLSNKEADSCHVIRYAIKEMDSPDFSVLWECIESAKSEYELIDLMDEYDYLPWAAGFILGEIGGLMALMQIESRLDPEHERWHFMLVRLISQLLIKYNELSKPFNPMMTVLDFKTRMQQQVPAKQNPEQYNRLKIRHEQERELFFPIPQYLVDQIETKLMPIPGRKFNVPKGHLIMMLINIKKDVDENLETENPEEKTSVVKNPDGRYSFIVGKNAKVGSFIKAMGEMFDEQMKELDKEEGQRPHKNPFGDTNGNK